MQNKPLNFKNGVYKLMQIADVQENPVFSPDTVRLLEAALDAEKPDLVIFTGDQIKGYSRKFSGINGAKNVEAAIKSLLSIVEKRNIFFTATFGNHDGQSALGNDEQFEIYKSSPFFVCSAPAAYDAFRLVLTDENGGERFAVYVFDSHSKAAGGGYDSVRPEQIKKYRDFRDELKERNGRYLPALVFQHVPTPEYYDVLKRVKRFSAGAIRAYGNHKNEFFVLDPNNSGPDDFLLENPAAPYKNSGEIDAFLEKGDVLGVYVGHDHKNSFVSKYKGLDLGYTPCAGFNAYGPGLKRGVRVFEITENGEYSTRIADFASLCPGGASDKLKFEAYRRAPSSVAAAATALKETALFLGVCAAAFAVGKIARRGK